MTNHAKIAVLISLVAMASLVAIYVAMNQANAQLREEIGALRSQQSGTSVERTHSAPEFKGLAEELTRLRTEHNELLRLRGEVGMLRRERANLEAKPAEADKFDSEAAVKQGLNKLADAKRNFLVPWALAIGAFAQAHDGESG